jgi:DNA-binding Xre family transcriptional regulator
MKLPDRNTIATEIRRIMDQKKVTGIDLSKALSVTTATVTHLRNGSASYELLKRALDTLDNWEETK